MRSAAPVGTTRGVGRSMGVGVQMLLLNTIMRVSRPLPIGPRLSECRIARPLPLALSLSPSSPPPHCPTWATSPKKLPSPVASPRCPSCLRVAHSSTVAYESVILEGALRGGGGWSGTTQVQGGRKSVGGGQSGVHLPVHAAWNGPEAKASSPTARAMNFSASASCSRSTRLTP